MIQAPAQRRRSFERYLHCQDALEDSVRNLIDRATAAGWTPHEIATAIINLSVDLFPEDRGALGNRRM